MSYFGYIKGMKCAQCGHTWVPRLKGRTPGVCPNCHSPYWKDSQITKKYKKRKSSEV